MNMNDRPFAKPDWSWQKGRSAPLAAAPMSSGGEQAPAAMNAAPQQDPTLAAVEGMAINKAIEGTAGVLEGGVKGALAGSAPLAANAGAIAPGMTQSAMLASQTAGMGATGLTAATGAGLGTGAITGAATAGAGAGAGAAAGMAPALAAMGPIGWAAGAYLGGKALGLFKDGTTNVGYQQGTPSVGGK
jgi:hypothetical protein